MSPGRAALWGAPLAVAALGAAGAAVLLLRCRPEAPAAFVLPAAPEEASANEVRQFCGACHAYPPPATFPRSAWRKEVKQGYDFFRASGLRVPFPSMEGVVRYYERRAPEALPPLEQTPPGAGSPVRFRRKGYALPGGEPYPAVTGVSLARLFDDRRLDVLVCDARRGEVLALRAYTEPPSWGLLGKVPVPARAEVVSFDGGKSRDVVVANLGSFAATDSKLGSVVLLRRTGAPVTLLEGVGRVADVKAGDFRGDGKPDLVVAVFGWRNTGEVLYLENKTTDPARPVFVPRVLDDRHGAVQVLVEDVDGDGRPDVVALISQEHEAVVAYLNRGAGRFDRKELFKGPHPAYGSSGIQLVDLNGDGKLDVLYTNGDTLDPPHLLKPYHGVQWLENRGGGEFVHHPIAPLYGAMSAVAADFRGGGRPDVVAVSYLAREEFPQRARLRLDSVLYLEQVGNGKYRRHALETVSCDHFTCAAGDLFGDGRACLVTGNFCLSKQRPLAEAVTIWAPERGNDSEP